MELRYNDAAAVQKSSISNSSMRIFIFIIILLFTFPVMAQDQSDDAAAAAKLPRFVSFKSDKVFVRAGPDTQYPVTWVYQRAGLPVEITAEYEAWRKIRDVEGGEGWVNKVMLSGKRTVLIKSAAAPVTLRDEPDAAAQIMARVEPQVVARLEKCDPGWCRVNADGYRGWVERNLLWGIYPGENLN